MILTRASFRLLRFQNLFKDALIMRLLCKIEIKVEPAEWNRPILRMLGCHLGLSQELLVAVEPSRPL